MQRSQTYDGYRNLDIRIPEWITVATTKCAKCTQFQIIPTRCTILGHSNSERPFGEHIIITVQTYFLSGSHFLYFLLTVIVPAYGGDYPFHKDTVSYDNPSVICSTSCSKSKKRSIKYRFTLEEGLLSLMQDIAH